MTRVVPEQVALAEEVCLRPVPDVPNTCLLQHDDQAEVTPEYELSAGTDVRLVDTPDALPGLYSAASCASERGGSCGVDAEWPPDTSAPGSKPVATLLQLAFSWDDKTEVFLVDLMTLGSNDVQELLWAVFADRGILKVGHSLKGDFAAIGRAAAAAAESSGDEAIEPQKGRQRQQQRSGAVAAVPVFDLSSNWHAFFGLSLANIAKAALGRTLDKSEQCSTWGLRPLTVPQRTYAAKDAAVCVSVFRQLCSSEGISRDLTAAEAASELQDLTRVAVAASKSSKGTSEPQGRKGRRGRSNDTEQGGDTDPEAEADTSSRGECFCYAYTGPPLPWPSGTPASAMRFVCDVSLEGLARMLRLCGVNAASPRRSCPEGKDVQQWVLEICCKREAPRVILTADRGLLRKVGGYPAYLVRSKGKQRQMHEVTQAFGMVVDEGDIMSRCSKCNGEFLLLAPGEAEGRVDDEVYLRYPERDYWACDSCGQVFWQGGQYHRGVEFVQQLVESLAVGSSSRV